MKEITSLQTFLVGYGDDGDARILTESGEPCAASEIDFLANALASYCRKQSSPSSEEVKAGYVYLIDGGGYYKIGKTGNVAKRYRQLGIKMPFPIEIEHYIECSDMHVVEYCWHELFRHKRIRGEWFHLDAQDVEDFCGNEKMYGIQAYIKLIAHNMSGLVADIKEHNIEVTLEEWERIGPMLEEIIQNVRTIQAHLFPEWDNFASDIKTASASQ